MRLTEILMRGNMIEFGLFKVCRTRKRGWCLGLLLAKGRESLLEGS